MCIRDRGGVVAVLKMILFPFDSFFFKGKLSIEPLRLRITSCARISLIDAPAPLIFSSIEYNSAFLFLLELMIARATDVSDADRIPCKVRSRVVLGAFFTTFFGDGSPNKLALTTSLIR